MLTPSLFDDHFFDNALKMPAVSKFFHMNDRVMNTDIKELDDHYEMAMELPGYKKEDVKAALEGGYLTIRAKREEEKNDQDENGRYLRRERCSGMVERSFYVGEEVKQEDIKAKFENGILTVRIPKAEAVEEDHAEERILIE